MCDLRDIGDMGSDKVGDMGDIVGDNVGVDRMCDVEGARYVIPTAFRSPDMSFGCGMKAIVTSPACPPSIIGFMGILTMLSRPVTSHFGIVFTFSASKYFQLRMRRAEVGSARIILLVPVAGSCRSVASLQWSVLG